MTSRCSKNIIVKYIFQISIRKISASNKLSGKVCSSESLRWEVNINSGNGLLPVQNQAIIWINADVLLIWHLGTNLSEISNKIQLAINKKMHLKILSTKWPKLLHVLTPEKSNE